VVCQHGLPRRHGPAPADRDHDPRRSLSRPRRSFRARPLRNASRTAAVTCSRK
jgi:hypothetical protein